MSEETNIQILCICFMFCFTDMAGRPWGPIQHVPRVLTLNELGNLRYKAADIYRLLSPNEPQ